MGRAGQGRRATGNGNGKRGLPTIDDPVEGLAPLPELPASERVFLTDGDIRVPVRRITVGGGEPPVDVYDPAGPRADRPARRGCPSCASPGSSGGSPAATSTSARCTTRAGRDHGGDAVRRAARGGDARVRARRGRARAGHHPRQPEPPGVGADDHRAQLPGEDQRQHRQLGGVVVDRRGGRQAALVGALGRRHGDGPVDRARTSTRRASGSSATRRCRSGRCRSTRRSRRWTARRRT